MVALDADGSACGDLLQRQVGVEIDGLVRTARGAILDEFVGDSGADGIAGVDRSGVVDDTDLGLARKVADVPDHVRRAVIGPAVRLVARHEIDQFERVVVPPERGDQDIGAAQVLLRRLVSVVGCDGERTAFFLIQQLGEDRRRIEIGQAAPVDAAPIADQCGALAVADHAVVEIVHETLIQVQDSPSTAHDVRHHTSARPKSQTRCARLGAVRFSGYQCTRR